MSIMILIDSSSTVVSRSPDNFPSNSLRTILMSAAVQQNKLYQRGALCIVSTAPEIEKHCSASVFIWMNTSGSLSAMFRTQLFHFSLISDTRHLILDTPSIQLITWSLVRWSKIITIILYFFECKQGKRLFQICTILREIFLDKKKPDVHWSFSMLNLPIRRDFYH